MSKYVLFFTNAEVVKSGLLQQFLIFKNETDLKQYIFYVICRKFILRRFHGRERHPDIKWFDGTMNKIFSDLPPLEDDEIIEEQIEIARERTNGEHLIYSVSFLLAVLRSIFLDESGIHLFHGEAIQAEELKDPQAKIKINAPEN